MSEIELTKGNLYRIRSRNLPYGVWNGMWFTGIREKFNYLYLSDEAGIALEDLGPVPEGIEISAMLSGPPSGRENGKLYQFLAEVEKSRPRVPGYGRRPGDPEPETEEDE